MQRSLSQIWIKIIPYTFYQTNTKLQSFIIYQTIMNPQIIQRTNSKIKQNEEIHDHTWTFQFKGQKRQYLVMKQVFSPMIFLGTAWLTENLLKLISEEGKSKLLEIGTGCGVTAIQVNLSNNAQVHACDLNQASVQNAIINANKHHANISVTESDVFSAYSSNDRFDIIYWNFPFHPAQTEYQTMTMIEKAVRDPFYKTLRRFLGESQDHLNEKGFVVMGFSLLMGDFKGFMEIAEENGWRWKQVGRMNEEGSICLIKLWK